MKSQAASCGENRQKIAFWWENITWTAENFQDYFIEKKSKFEKEWNENTTRLEEHYLEKSHNHIEDKPKIG